MSGAAQGPGPTAKLQEDKKPAGEPQKEQQTQQPALLEEDDEFEDFPVEGMPACRSEKIHTLITMCHRLDRGREQSTGRQCTPVGGELGRR